MCRLCYEVFIVVGFDFECTIPEFSCVASIVEKCFIMHLRLSMFLIMIIVTGTCVFAFFAKRSHRVQSVRENAGANHSA